MKLNRQNIQAKQQAVMAFTMLEIALCLGIIGISLVAIIGIMPTGMQVQKDNREDTIILAEGQALLEAVRTGNTNGVSYLPANLAWFEAYSNSVMITNVSFGAGGGFSQDFLISALSTPKYTAAGASIVTNVVRMKLIANNGALSLQSTNARSLAFGYVVTSEVLPFVSTAATNSAVSNAISSSLYDVRLTLQWPVFGNHSVGANKQTFRTIVGGRQLVVTNGGAIYYFFQPNTF